MRRYVILFAFVSLLLPATAFAQTQRTPDAAINHYKNALKKSGNGDFDGAIEDYSKAIELAPKASEHERAYINALSKRYSSDINADKTKLAVDYKNAMGELARNYPDDLDAATLYAESMMNLRPWKLWTLDGKPAPVIDGFSGEQRLFLGWAQVWRTLWRDDALRQQLVNGTHSPGHIRAFAPLRNIDAWYDAFDVSTSDPLYVKPEDRVRIW